MRRKWCRRDPFGHPYLVFDVVRDAKAILRYRRAGLVGKYGSEVGVVGTRAIRGCDDGCGGIGGVLLWGGLAVHVSLATWHIAPVWFFSMAWR